MDINIQNVIKVIQKIKTLDVPSDIEFVNVRLREDLGLDSLDYITLVFELERAFNVEIPQRFEAPETLNELIEKLKGIKKCTTT